MAGMYLLLPDAREQHEAWWPAAQAGFRAFNATAGDYQPYFRPVSAVSPIGAWVSVGPMDQDTMLSILRGIDWAYPARLLYRTRSENGWSFVTLGLSLRPEWGEEAA